jgi:hypothetical protein
MDPVGQHYDRLGLFDFEDLFSRSMAPQILNTRDRMTKNVAKEIAGSLFSEAGSDISYVPQCYCGNLRGEFYSVRKGEKPVTCKLCGTVCKTQFANNDFDAWFRIPKGMPPLPHPMIYGMLRRIMGKDLKRLLDMKVDEKDKLIKIIPYRGYAQFYEHFDEIMNLIATKYPPVLKKPEKRIRMRNLITLIHEYPSAVFTRYLPVLSSSLHVESGEGNKKYLDKQSTKPLDITVNLSCFDFNVSYGHEGSPKWVNRRVDEVYTTYLEYTASIIKDKLGKKKGMVKHHCGGTRCNFTCRAVLTPIIGPHDPDELHLPWKAGLMLFKLELINLLKQMDRSYTIDTIMSIWRKAFYKYNPIIDQLFRKILSPNGARGRCMTVGRNPSIEYGSSVKLRCTKIKTDVYDHTLNISMSNVERLNADCDGDELFVIDFKEQNQVERFELLHPAYMQLSQAAIKISTSITPPKQLCIQAFARLEDDTLNSSYGSCISIRDK